jgi:hypothetical protein
MTLALARAVMALAARCLGDHRREWALAMEAELDAAAEAGGPLRFAFGCLLAAWREMLAHEEGRFALASHVLAAGVIVPMAGLMLFSVALGFPYLAPHETGNSRLFGSGEPVSINEANLVGLPLMAALTTGLGFGHLLMAWEMLDRDWRRVATLGRIAAAVMVMMVLFSGILFIYETCALPQTAAMVIELAAIGVLVRWHDQLPVSAHQDARVRETGQ